MLTGSGLGTIFHILTGVGFKTVLEFGFWVHLTLTVCILSHWPSHTGALVLVAIKHMQGGWEKSQMGKGSSSHPTTVTEIRLQATHRSPHVASLNLLGPTRYLKIGLR